MRATLVLSCAVTACLTKPPPPPSESQMCASFGAWSAPVPLASLAVANAGEHGPWLSADRNELWYSDTDFGSIARVMRAVRSSPSQPFPAGVDMSSLVTNDFDDNAAVFLADGGRELWFDHFQSTHLIRVERRADTTQPFGASVDADVSGDAMFDTYDAALTSDETTLVYSRGMDNGQADLWIATRPSRTDVFGGGAPVMGVNSTDGDCCATLSGDGNSMWFSSDRNGTPKLYKTTRAGPGSAFTMPELQERQDLSVGLANDDPAVSFDTLSLVYVQDHKLVEMQRDCL